MAETTKEKVEHLETEIEEKVEKAGDKAKEKAEAQGLSEEEVTARVERARKEEKDKLYPQLEELKEALKEVQETLRVEREEKENLKKKAKEEAEKERQSQLSESEKMNEVLLRLEEQLKQERKDRERFEKEVSETRKRDELRQYRETAIQKAGPNIITELVGGSSKDEIDQSVAIAKTRYEELAERIKTEAGDQIRKDLSRSANPDFEALEEEELANNLAQVDLDRYAKDKTYQNQVKANIEAAYKRSMGR